VALGFLSALRRRVLARRRLLAFALTAAAVGVGVHAARPAPPPSATLTVASHDLPAGTVIAPGDLAAASVPPADVPSGAVSDPVGSVLAAPLRRGEPVTDLRLVGPGPVDGHPELTALPVRIPDPAMAGLLRPGDRVDLLSTDPHSGRTAPVADGVLVLGIPPATGGDNTGGLTGRLVLVGVPTGAVTAVTSAAVGGFLTFAYDH